MTIVNLNGDIKNALLADSALVTLLGGNFVWQITPGDPDQYPRITYFELTNADSEFAEDSAYSSRIRFQIDVWTKPGKATETDIGARVDAVMKSLGFFRTYATTMVEEGTEVIIHRPMRYRISKSY